jgi:hypothetical protein
MSDKIDHDRRLLLSAAMSLGAADFVLGGAAAAPAVSAAVSASAFGPLAAVTGCVASLIAGAQRLRGPGARTYRGFLRATDEAVVVAIAV